MVERREEEGNGGKRKLREGRKGMQGRGKEDWRPFNSIGDDEHNHLQLLSIF